MPKEGTINATAVCNHLNFVGALNIVYSPVIIADYPISKCSNLKPKHETWFVFLDFVDERMKADFNVT